MLFTHDFVVQLPIDQAWALFTDLERVAPCLPGARLTDSDGDSYSGTVKVKVGPVTAQYSGTARFVERDDAQHRAVIAAAGRDTRGQGTASATITAQLTAKGPETGVVMETDLAITGKVAQFGRGIMSDVSDALLKQFLRNLESLDVNAPEASAAAETSSKGVADTASPTPPAQAATTPASDAPMLDLGGMVALPMLKRLAPPAAAALTAVIAIAALRRGRARSVRSWSDSTDGGAYASGFRAGYESAVRLQATLRSELSGDD